MTSKFSLVAAIFAAGTLASCSDAMFAYINGGAGAEGSGETQTASAATAPPVTVPPVTVPGSAVTTVETASRDMGTHVDMNAPGDSMETSQSAAIPRSPSTNTGVTRSVVDGICEGTSCTGTEDLAGFSATDEFISATSN